MAPNYAAAHFHLGLALMKQSKQAAAGASCGEVVRIAPDTEIGRTALRYLELLR